MLVSLQLHRNGYQIRLHHGINLLNSGQFNVLKNDCIGLESEMQLVTCISKGCNDPEHNRKIRLHLFFNRTYAYGIKCIYKIRLLFFPSLSGMSVL